jgi:hypothetical protein
MNFAEADPVGNDAVGEHENAENACDEMVRCHTVAVEGPCSYSVTGHMLTCPNVFSVYARYLSSTNSI